MRISVFFIPKNIRTPKNINYIDPYGIKFELVQMTFCSVEMVNNVNHDQTASETEFGLRCWVRPICSNILTLSLLVTAFVVC